MLVPRLDILGGYADVMRYGRYKNVGICTWRGQATGLAVREVTDIVAGMLARGTELYSFIHLVPNRVPLPDSEAREGLIALMKQYEVRTACAAIVIGGTGFWASAMRNAVIGLRVVVPRSFEYRLHGDSDEILSWLPIAHSKRTGIEVTDHQLKRVLAESKDWQIAAAS